ncbi:hypothetical protein [Sphingobium sp. CR28]|uniref:hypothetical protein n=1 Tax=Sphingobium sp. CR28 TaxID=3400272 RepID=UPI003FF11E5D
MVHWPIRTRGPQRPFVVKETTRDVVAIAGIFGGLAVAALVVDFCITCVMF